MRLRATSARAIRGGFPGVLTELFGGFGFPRERNLYGIVYHPSPTTMTGNNASITDWGKFSIPAGVGQTYQSVVSTNFSFAISGARVLLFVVVSAGSGTHSAPVVRFTSAALGTQNITMTQEAPGLWVVEQTAPVNGYTSILFTLTSTSATEPITGTLVHFSVSPAGAIGTVPQADAQSLASWVTGGYQEGNGNLWPTEKASVSVPAGSSLVSRRVDGITVTNQDRLLVLVYAVSTDGTPALLDRLYIRAVSGTDISSLANVFLEPVANRPGVYARWITFASLAAPSAYLEMNFDNAQAAAFYPQKAITVQAIQVYKNPPATFTSPSSLTFPASDGIVAKSFDGILDVYTPMSSVSGNEYICWQSRRYNTTGSAAGGGFGSVLEALYYCRRVDGSDFKPVYRLTDTGLNEFAMKQNDGSDQNVGHDIHGGQARRADPVFRIDGVAQPATTRADFYCQKVEWIEYTKIFNYTDGTTVIANLDTTKTWEGATFKLKQEITFLQTADMLTLYLFMLSFYANTDNTSALGLTFNQFVMPNSNNALYTPGTGVNATYPAQTRFICTGSMGWTFDIAVQGSVLPAFRSWIQSGASSRKFYMSAIGQHDSFGLIDERVPYTVAAGTTITLETWVTATK